MSIWLILVSVQITCHEGDVKKFGTFGGRFVVLCALLPDIDHFAQLVYPQLEEYIHGPTHSIAACLLLAFVIALLLKATKVSVSFGKIFLIFTYLPFKKYWDMKGAARQKQLIEQRAEKAKKLALHDH